MGQDEMKMDQAEIIEALQEVSNKQKSAVPLIKLYAERYMVSKSDDDFIELTKQLERYAGGHVISKLSQCGLYSREHLEDVYQEARLTVFLKLKDGLSDLETPDAITQYFVSIYINTTRVFITKNIKHLDNTVSVYERTDDQDTINIIETIPDEPANQPDVEVLNDLKKDVYKQTGKKYFETFMNHVDFFPKNISYYYMRALPHTKGMDSKTTWVLWGISEMGDNTTEQLSVLSEERIKRDISEDLRWGDSLKDQLEDIIDLNGKDVCLKEVKIAKAYPTRRFYDWVESMQTKIERKLLDEINKDRELSRAIKNYSDEDEFLMRFLPSRAKGNERSER